MNDELEILQCLIENRIFAPSPSALAKKTCIQRENDHLSCHGRKGFF